MTCSECEAEMEATQETRVSEDYRKLGTVAAFVGILLVGGALGLGIPVIMGGGIGDLSWLLIAVPVGLVVCTPLLVMGALRIVSEKEIWHCHQCGYQLDR